MNDCRRTFGLIDRLVDGRVTDADRRHAASCASCGPVLSRAAGFDDALRRSARALVAEELPRGILDQPLAGRSPGVASRRSAPGSASILAAVAVLLTATVIALAPGTAPVATPAPSATIGPTPTPAATPQTPRFVERFRSTDAIRGSLVKLGYRCNDGAPVPSPGSAPDAVVKESTVCLAPDSIGPFAAAVIVGEAVNGKVAALTIKADIVGGDSVDKRPAVAAAVAKIFALALLDEGAAQSGGGWATVHLPELEAGDDNEVVLRQVDFHASRQPNLSYLVEVKGGLPG